MKNKIYLQVDPEAIENFVGLKKDSLKEEDLEKIIDIFSEEDLYFIINEDKVNDFISYGLKTISSSEKSYITNIYSENIDNYIEKKLNNVYLHVNEENDLFNTFSKIYKNVNGFIELKLKDPNKIDLNLLEKEVEKIYFSLKDLEKSGTKLIVKNITGWKIKEKFSEWGDNAYFVSPDKNVYLCPLDYYNDKKILCKIEDFHSMKLKNRYSRPHLICLVCETFYCDKSIYYNKLHTSEYKVPGSKMCNLTTLFTKYSKKLFNELLDEASGLKIEELDKVNEFVADSYYDKFKDGKCMTNKIKKTNFENKR